MNYYEYFMGHHYIELNNVNMGQSFTDVLISIINL